MVALLVQLKLRLIAGSLRRSAWRTVGLVLGSLYALSLVGIALVAQLGLRFGPDDGRVYAGPASVLGFAALTLGWLVLPVLISGIDETVDPGRFALLPLRAAELQPGLLVAALLGVPGVATVLVAAGQLIVWAQAPVTLLVALLSVPLGVVTCVLLARVATSGLGRLLARRRLRELGTGIATVGIITVGLGSSMLTQGLAHSVRSPAQLLPLIDRAALIVGWTPFGWAWSAPAEASRGAVLPAVVKLALALALVALLWLAWRVLLDRALVSPLGADNSGGRVRTGRVLDRLSMGSPAGAVAARSLRYWRRDPRYLAGGIVSLLMPIVLVVTNGITSSDGTLSPALLAAPLGLGFFAGMTAAQELSYDGTALWLHATSGLRGAEDRLGRAIAVLMVSLPMLLVLLVLAGLLTGRGDLELSAAAGALAVILGGTGVGVLVGSYLQVAVPPPGANPFQSNSGGGIHGLISMLLTLAGTGLTALPALVLAALGMHSPPLAVLAVVVAVAIGSLVLAVGVRAGGQRLDRAWPEVLAAVSRATD